jgi:hypothetical protein
MSTELENVPKPGPLATAMPDFLKNIHGQEGLENVGREDIILPRLSVCQGLSPQRQRSKPQFIEGLNDGMMFNTVTKDIYGERVEVLPIIYTKSRIYFKDIKEGGGIICQSTNGIDGGTIAPTCDACPNSKFQGNNAPICNVFMNIVCMLLPSRQLIILSFKSTELKAARGWVTLMKSRNKPMYTQVYAIRTVEQSNTKGTFFGRVIDFKRFVSEEEYKFALDRYNELKGKVITHDADEVEAAESGQDENIPF